MSQTTNGGGIGVPGALLVVFVTLKLTKVIDWSWWWVVSLVWVLSILLFGIVAGFAIYEASKK